MKQSTSLPLRKCGLKYHGFVSVSPQYIVTSLAEVWIEIYLKYLHPHNFLSLPLRKCGLKYYHSYCFLVCTVSLPLRKCGLKSARNRYSITYNASLPLRKCGLKFCVVQQQSASCGHFPCGSVDWNLVFALFLSMWTVTSLAEVWIEINCVDVPWSSDWCHFPCGSVDWNMEDYRIDLIDEQSLPLRKCGLKYG